MKFFCILGRQISYGSLNPRENMWDVIVSPLRYATFVFICSATIKLFLILIIMRMGSTFWWYESIKMKKIEKLTVLKVLNIVNLIRLIDLIIGITISGLSMKNISYCISVYSWFLLYNTRWSSLVSKCYKISYIRTYDYRPKFISIKHFFFKWNLL